MADRISVHRSIDNAETVRQARELAWVCCLLLVLCPAGYLGWLLAGQGTFDATRGVVFVLVPVVAEVRFGLVAMQLGRNLRDHEFLMRMDSWTWSFIYLGARVIGLEKAGVAESGDPDEADG